MKYLVLIFVVSVLLSCSKEDTCTCVRQEGLVGNNISGTYYEESEFTVELEDGESCYNHEQHYAANQGQDINCTLD